MPLLSVERDTEILIDNQLRNLGWQNDPHLPGRNVYQQRVKTQHSAQNSKERNPIMSCIRQIRAVRSL